MALSNVSVERCDKRLLQRKTMRASRTSYNSIHSYLSRKGLFTKTIVTGSPYIFANLLDFQSFCHLSKRILKQMIHQLKAPIKSSLIHIRYWVWHHPGGRNASLTEKALLLLKLVWGLPCQNFFQFQNWKYFFHGRLTTSFSKSNAFSVKGACPPSEWCHAQFLL